MQESVRLEAIGLDHHRRDELSTLGDATPGRVVRLDRGAVVVQTDEGTVQVPLDVGADVAVGDFVALRDGAVVHVGERRSMLTRLVGHRRDTLQVLATNVDLVLVVRSVDLSTSPRRIQSLVNLAYESGSMPVVLLTKSDLVEDCSEHVEAILEDAPGVEVLLVSAWSGEGVDELRARCAGRTVILVGESGAGKSTLTNLLTGGDIETGETRRDGQGRHVTTSRELHPLPGGGALIDTPGVRQVTGALSAEQIAEGFADVESLASGCRFSDCEHATEPGCGVRGALEDGSLAPGRYEAYVAALRDAAWNARRESRRLRAEDRRSHRLLERQRRRDSW